MTNNIYFVKEDREKESIASKIRLDIFIDDNLDVLQELNSVSQKFLFDPFKVYKNVPQGINFLESWVEFIKYVNK